jgi:PAS domain-containing protein
VQVTAYDITSFTELEEELKVGLGERFARAVTEIAPIMMYVYDRRERRNIWANRSYLEAVASFAGVVVSELEEVDIMGLIHPDDRALIVDRNKTWGAGGPPPLDDIEIRLGDGTHWTWFLHRSAAFERGEAGDITKTIGFLTDISLQKTAEAQLQRHCRGR